jgi:ribosomal protein L23
MSVPFWQKNKKTKPESTESESTPKDYSIKTPTHTASNPYVVLYPILTEKAMRQRSENNSYVFVVSRNATKSEIKKEIKKRWNVDVERVNIINLPRLIKKQGGRISKKRGAIKKAIVTLKEGQTLQIP